MPQQVPNQLIDRFGRQVTYLRISVTDRCDLRCVYCMCEDMTFVPRSQLLTLEELSTIARCFIELGVSKLRLTGGEPLVRKDVLSLFNDLGRMRKNGSLKDLTITTNGTQLSRYAQDLYDRGVTRINVSLDTLRADRFKRMTRVGDIQKTLNGLEAIRKVGFQRIKLNSVILKNRNHDEINDLVDFAVTNDFDITFIEEMPLGEISHHNRAEAYYSSAQVRADIHHDLIRTNDNTGGPARYHRVAGTDTRIGFISPHSHNFCDTCNRVRLTATGILLLCLGQEHSVDLRRVIRAHPGDDAKLKQSIVESMSLKPKGHEFDIQAKPVIFRHMSSTGG
jgi:cyclic pyranopterin phosphate synthase